MCHLHPLACSLIIVAVLVTEKGVVDHVERTPLRASAVDLQVFDDHKLHQLIRNFSGSTGSPTFWLTSIYDSLIGLIRYLANRRNLKVEANYSMDAGQLVGSDSVIKTRFEADTTHRGCSHRCPWKLIFQDRVYPEAIANSRAPGFGKTSVPTPCPRENLNKIAPDSALQLFGCSIDAIARTFHVRFRFL